MKRRILVLIFIGFLTQSSKTVCPKLAEELASIMHSQENGKTRRVIALLASSRETAAEKAKAWREFAKTLKVKADFEQKVVRPKDNSWAFIGPTGQTLLIAPNGEVFYAPSRVPISKEAVPPYELMRNMSAEQTRSPD